MKLRQLALTPIILCAILTLSTSYADQYVSPMMQSQDQGQNSASVSPMMTGSSSAQDSNSVSPMMAGGSGYSGDTSAYHQPKAVDDPWEPMNRVIFDFDESLDKYFLKPVSQVYMDIVPRPLTKGIHNVFSNVSNIQNIGNDLLQANFYQATSDAWRLAINTTAGLGGTFDVASNIGLYQNDEDFGLTLARWGYTDSRYLVLPFFGPSTIRDTIGLPVDYYLFSVYPYINNIRWRYTIYALSIVSKRAQLLQYQDLYEQFAIDKYTFVRNAFMQQREGQIQRNNELSDPYFTIEPPKKPVNTANDSVPLTNA